MRYLYGRKGPVRVLILLGLLSVSLFMLGTIGVFLVWKLNRAYTEVVSTDLPLQGHLRSITTNSNNTRRAINGAIQAKLSGGDVTRFSLDFDRWVASNNANFEGIGKLLHYSESDAFFSLQLQRMAYVREAKSLLSELSGLTDVQLTERRQFLDQLYGKYSEKQDFLANELGQQVAMKSARISRQGYMLTIFLVLVALWPIIVAASFFIYASMVTFISFIKNR